jgi:hypothetical protein
MTGWSTKPEVIALRDEIIGKLEAEEKKTRQHAWYWISFHMEVVDELEVGTVGTPLDDDAIEWLKQHPDRFIRYRDTVARLVKLYEGRLVQAKLELQRLGED